jgi:hypothetical protein
VHSAVIADFEDRGADSVTFANFPLSEGFLASRPKDAKSLENLQIWQKRESLIGVGNFFAEYLVACTKHLASCSRNKMHMQEHSLYRLMHQRLGCHSKMYDWFRSPIRSNFVGSDSIGLQNRRGERRRRCSTNPTAVKRESNHLSNRSSSRQSAYDCPRIQFADAQLIDSHASKSQNDLSKSFSVETVESGRD